MHEDRFTIVEDVVAPGEEGDTHHLVDHQTQALVTPLWSAYLAKARADLAPSPVTPALRRVSYQLDSETFVGEKLQRGIRAVGRSNRACTFAVGLWHADTGQFVQQGEMVTVFIEPGQGSVAIPDDFWAAVEAIEGRTIAVPDQA